MDWGQTITTLVTVLIGSGLIQFFFNRKDKKEEDAKKNNADSVKKELKDHLINVNNQWKEDYCDKNKKAIEDLSKEVKEGLEEREKKGLERFEEHKEAIKELQKVMLNLAKDSEENKKIMAMLTKDAEERKKLDASIAKSLLGITHDKLVYLGKYYQRRGAITLSEKANLRMLYTPYHDELGGNSDGEGYYNYCMNLPVVTDEEAKKMDDDNKQEVFRHIAN